MRQNRPDQTLTSPILLYCYYWAADAVTHFLNFYCGGCCLFHTGVVVLIYAVTAIGGVREERIFIHSYNAWLKHSVEDGE